MGKSIVTGTVPDFGVTPSGLEQGADASQRELSAESIRAVATEIARAEDNTATYDAILAAAGL
jgi:hypothetical protein